MMVKLVVIIANVENDRLNVKVNSKIVLILELSYCGYIYPARRTNVLQVFFLFYFKTTSYSVIPIAKGKE